MKRVFIATAMMVVGSATVQAQDFTPYAGVGLGVFGLEAKDSSVNFNQKNTVFGGYAKFGVDANDYIGAELRVGTTSKGDQSYPAGAIFAGSVAGTIDQKADYFFSYLAKLQYPVSQDFRAYAMLGATTAKHKVIMPPALGTSGSNTKTGFSYGVGGDFTINDQLSVGGEWMQYWSNVTVDVNQKVKIWGAVGTLTMHF
ncbi:porin family protein [Mariprofundus sp. EBB-1]|uniref:porin family protein n=1 Tax=Mariprofundus sp. EBB-1 TaxID=2650971 RepID=UPI001912EDE5|nr:porin family protein [Mariprofundus sp. EBB-1]